MILVLKEIGLVKAHLRVGCYIGLSSIFDRNSSVIWPLVVKTHSIFPIRRPNPVIRTVRILASSPHAFHPVFVWVQAREILFCLRVAMWRAYSVFIKFSAVQGLELGFCTPAWDIVLLEGSHYSELITVCDHVFLIFPLDLFIRYLDHRAVRVLNLKKVIFNCWSPLHRGQSLQLILTQRYRFLALIVARIELQNTLDLSLRF